MKEKTFCDPIYPCSEETGQRFLRFYEQLAKERNMKEKKTKKMTKAEAFEYLKNRKVNTNGGHEEVLKKLFECGIEWNGGGRNIVDYGNYLIIDNDGHLFHCGCDMDGRYWRTHLNEEISIDDILSIEIVEDKYELEFNYDKVVELAKPLMHYLNEVGCQDSIRISQLGIVHEPMSTLIFDPAIGE